MTYRVLAVLTFVVVTACAQSPLYDTARTPGGTRDEVPRDGNGEPMLGKVRPIPLGALPATQPGG